MGTVTFGPPEGLILALKNEFGLSTFIETGTFKARTTNWAARHFDKVKTVELSKQFHSDAQARYASVRNIEFLHGDSPDVLRKLVPALNAPALFWLDAHWCDGATAGWETECPILEELTILDASPHDHFILIDDARIHLSPAPRPHRPELWPDIWTVHEALMRGRPDRYVIVFRDVIVAVPGKARQLVLDYCHNFNPNDTPLRRALRPVKRMLQRTAGAS